jgi:hypothetical protein
MRKTLYGATEDLNSFRASEIEERIVPIHENLFDSICDNVLHEAWIH